MRIGIAGKIRLLSFVAFVISVIMVLLLDSVIEAQFPTNDIAELNQEFEEATTVIVSLQDNPRHISIVETWLGSAYPHSSYVIVDEEYNLITQSKIQSDAERLEDYGWILEELGDDYLYWSVIVPFTDNNGQRFYAKMLHDLPYVFPAYIEMMELGIPLLIITIFLLTTMIMARIIVKPIQQVANTANQIADGNLQQRTGVSRQDEIGDLARAFDEMAESNLQLLTAQKQLIAQVGHELRTPLARVQVAMDILQERMAVNDQAQMRDVRNDIEEMSRLISDILVVSRLETASLSGMIAETLRMEEFDVESWALAVVQRFRELFPERTLTHCFVDLGFFVGDRMLLGRVLWNLLENAHKYSFMEKAVSIQISMHQAQLLIEVKDEGEGIPQEHLDGAFEPFFQGRGSEISTTKGFGLGLSLCKQVVLAHCGTIELKNRSVKGLIAQVTLPIHSTNAGQE